MDPNAPTTPPVPSGDDSTPPAVDPGLPPVDSPAPSEPSDPVAPPAEEPSTGGLPGDGSSPAPSEPADSLPSFAPSEPPAADDGSAAPGADTPQAPSGL